MTTTARTFTRLAATALFVAATQLITAPAVIAAPDEYRSAWMAASGTEPGFSANWGRLTLREGVLSFESTNTEWQLPLADIKRAAISEQSNQVIVLEGTTGEKYYVSIHGPQMTVESPRKALHVIRKALRAPAARRE
jgi:hypothetical protein